MIDMSAMTMTEARAALPQVLDRVAAGEEITITRHGKPAAVVVRPGIAYPQPRVEVAAGGLHAATRRRGAAGRRILHAAPMDVEDLLSELDSIRGRRA
jgi:antitoxin (DNA-binding transcriptional repressor) of toxin-antitoxin stability system